MLAVVLSLTAALLVGPVRLLSPSGAAAYDAHPRPRWALGPRLIGVGGVAAYLLEAGIVVARIGEQVDLPVWLWVFHAVSGVVWWWLFLGRRRLGAAFTVVCVDATASFMLVGAFMAYGQPLAQLLWLPLIWLLVAATAIFGIWQATGAVSEDTGP